MPERCSKGRPFDLCFRALFLEDCYSKDVNQGAVSIWRCRLTSIGIPMLKIRRSRDRLMFNIVIPYLGKTVIILRRAQDANFPIVLRILYLEGHVVGYHDGSVEGEEEDDPVPGGFEGGVVEDDVWRRLGGLLTVLREDVRVQIHHLKHTDSWQVRSII